MEKYFFHYGNFHASLRDFSLIRRRLILKAEEFIVFLPVVFLLY
jgi:hypothetical protein